MVVTFVGINLLGEHGSRKYTRGFFHVFASGMVGTFIVLCLKVAFTLLQLNGIWRRAMLSRNGASVSLFWKRGMGPLRQTPYGLLLRPRSPSGWSRSIEANVQVVFCFCCWKIVELIGNVIF